MELNEIANKIHKKYCHLEMTEINDMLDIAKEILLNTLYPFDDNIVEIPPRKTNWLYRCVIEQIERKGMNSAVSYKENGLQVTFDKTQISQSLLDELVPMSKWV